MHVSKFLFKSNFQTSASVFQRRVETPPLPTGPLLTRQMGAKLPAHLYSLGGKLFSNNCFNGAMLGQDLTLLLILPPVRRGTGDKHPQFKVLSALICITRGIY